MLSDYYFWFSQPSSFLSNFDKISGLTFAVLFALGLLLFGAKFLVQNTVTKKLVNRFFHLLTWIGLAGLIWFGFRYESTPFLGKRFWAGLIALVGIIWLGWVLYSLLFKYRSERKVFFEESVKQRYLPKSKK